MRNVLYIKRYTINPIGARKPKQTLLERIRTYFKGQRFITTTKQRCTSLDHATDFIRWIGIKQIIRAEWIDRNGTSIQIVRNGESALGTVAVNRVSKEVKVIQEATP